MSGQRTRFLVAMHMALLERDMPAVIALLHQLASVDPAAADVVRLAIERRTEPTPPEPETAHVEPEGARG